MDEQFPSRARTEPGGPRGWHSRGYMPHFDSNDVVQHVTLHLADSLPSNVIENLTAKLEEIDPELRAAERRRQLEALIDAGHGACWLRRPECAGIVQDALLHFDGERYRLIAWVVMPNHVHVLFQTIGGWEMAKVVASWKSWTGKLIADIVFKESQPRQDGAWRSQVWHREYWDRFIRNEQHFENAVAYIHNNPVKAGLVPRPENWPWSSAPGTATLRGGAVEERA